VSVADYILEKIGDRLRDRRHVYYIITINGEIYDLNDYEDLLKEGIAVSKPHIFIANLWFISWFGNNAMLYYPFIYNRGLLIDVYLLKHHFHFDELKYIAIINHLSSTNQAVMEVADIELIASNTNLSGLVQMLSDERGYEKMKELEEQFENQSLFNGYNFVEAAEIIKEYWDVSLADKVKDAYYRVFQPYRKILEEASP